MVLGGGACPGDDDDSAGDDDMADDDSADDDSAGDDDTSWGDPGAQEPPSLDPLPARTNAAAVQVTGTAEIGDSLVRAYNLDLSSPDTISADGGGSFAVDVGLGFGNNTLQVTAEADGLESLPASAAVERCTPGDPNEADGGNSCEDAIDLGVLFDDGTVRTVSGNALEEGDEDWYVFMAADDYIADLAAGADEWAVDIHFIANHSDTFRMTVHKGSCDAALCEDEPGGYTEYTDEVDQTPCGGLANECADDTVPFYIRVVAGEAGDCEGYTLSIRNG
jgi:hypothetical protein